MYPNGLKNTSVKDRPHLERRNNIGFLHIPSCISILVYVGKCEYFYENTTTVTLDKVVSNNFRRRKVTILFYGLVGSVSVHRLCPYVYVAKYRWYVVTLNNQLTPKSHKIQQMSADLYGEMFVVI